MKNSKIVYAGAILLLTMITSACGQNASSGGSAATAKATATAQVQASPSSAVNGEQQILIIIDQTPKPTTEIRSFDFSIQQVPEGYTLNSMQWVSDKHSISSTPQEALLNGQSGADGFYISGNGQFSGFFYPLEMKGETGEVSFQFTNDQGQELNWKKEITLK